MKFGLAKSLNFFFIFSVLLILLFTGFSSDPSNNFLNLEEHFYKKNLFIEYYNRLRIKLGDRVFPTVLIGEDGWMEYIPGNNLDDFQNAKIFTPQSLSNTAQVINACHKFAAENNIVFFMVMAPNKASIYPEKLPKVIQPLNSLSEIDQLNNYLRDNNIPEVLDLRPVLIQARKDGDVYYLTDTHWNGYGAYIAYEAIITHLSKMYPGLEEPYSLKFFRIRKENKDVTLGTAKQIQANYINEPLLAPTRKLNDIVSVINFPDVNDYHKLSWIPESDLPTLMLFHDSFGFLYLNDMLSVNFAKVHYFHRASSEKYLNPKTIKLFSPDIIIYQVVERNLGAIEKDLSFCSPAE